MYPYNNLKLDLDKNNRTESYDMYTAFKYHINMKKENKLQNSISTLSAFKSMASIVVKDTS